MNEGHPLIELFDLFIFDLDGTLIDSIQQIESAMNEARTGLGYRISPSGQIFQKLGLPVENLFFDLDLSPDKAESLILEFRKNLNHKIKQGNKCFPHVVSLVTQIRLLNKKVAVATSKSTAMATNVIRNSLLDGLIDFVQGTDNFPAKPNPEVIKRCLQRYPGLRAVMIGDRVEDVEAARSAGVPAIGIAQSAHSTKALRAAGAITAYTNFKPFLKTSIWFQ
jgi:phosphoglycolate phosphatase